MQDAQPKLPRRVIMAGWPLGAKRSLHPVVRPRGHDLRIADHILAGSTEIDQLAAASGADAASLHRVLRRLVSQGLFEEPAPGRFALNGRSSAAG